MSKIGQKTITVPQTVTVFVDKRTITVKGPKGELQFKLPKVLEAVLDDNVFSVTRSNEMKKTKSLHGLYRQLIYNAVVGVENLWHKKLEVVGTGYNVKLQGEDLVFRLGLSHPVVFKKIPGIQYQVDGGNKVIISGVDKQLVGQTAYQIKMVKKPDVYKGKGIRYQGEKLRIKPGKKAKTMIGAPAA